VKTIGIDPGTSGAMALYDSETGALEVLDLPVVAALMKSRKSGTCKQLDLVALQSALGVWHWGNGAELALLEQVSARPLEGPAGAFSFGRTYGQLEALLTLSGMRLERVQPAKWKAAMKCPGKTKGAKPAETAAAIAQRADEIFPAYRALWRGPRGGVLLDRAEAALMAKYAAQEFRT